ncbi:MAG: hypothetical protein IPK98_18200 [Chloracidobacterium sp.]|nr:hypothetical protein [Chloracidobacterium sp.]
MKLQAKINGEKLDIEIVEQDGKPERSLAGANTSLRYRSPSLAFLLCETAKR